MFYTSAYARRAQRAIADLVPGALSDRNNDTTSWLGAINDKVLTALLVYGYPVLGLILFLGSVGLPLPDGVATMVAGSLASQGCLDWLWAATITVMASVLGDTVGYGLVRYLSREILERHGRWMGYTAQRREHQPNRCSTDGDGLQSSSRAPSCRISARSRAFGRNDQLSLIEIHGDRTARTFRSRNGQSQHQLRHRI